MKIVNVLEVSEILRVENKKKGAHEIFKNQLQIIKFHLRNAKTLRKYIF